MANQRLSSKKAVLDWLIEIGIENAVVADDLSVSVHGDVSIVRRKLESFPVQFSVIHGSFNCNNNKLTSLDGAPAEVHGGFYCSNNHLVTLRGGPEKVGGNYTCTGNRLSLLEGASCEVRGNFLCFGNTLDSLVGAPRFIGGDFVCGGWSRNDLRGKIKEVFELGQYFSAKNMTALCEEVRAEICADQMRAVVHSAMHSAPVAKRSARSYR